MLGGFLLFNRDKELWYSAAKSFDKISLSAKQKHEKRRCSNQVLLSETLTENSKGSPNVSTTKNDRKSSCGIKKHPLISPKSSDAKVKSKQVTTKTVTSEKEKMKGGHQGKQVAGQMQGRGGGEG